METITIKKSEYDRLKIENETLKRELENTKEPTEFLGKKASEWLRLKDLICCIIHYCYYQKKGLCDDYFEVLSSEKLWKIVHSIEKKIIEYDKMNKFLSEFDIKLQNLKDDINKQNENML